MIFHASHIVKHVKYTTYKGQASVLRPSKGFLGTQGKKGIYFRRTGEQRPNFDGNRGTKTILGNREHKKTAHFQFFGNMGTSQFISGEQGTRYPPGRASVLVSGPATRVGQIHYNFT